MNTRLRIQCVVNIILFLALITFFVPSIPTTAQSTATVSGAVRHDGNPAANVHVAAVWEGGDQATVTGPDGRYSVSGVPMGSWVNVHVRPPLVQRLAFSHWHSERLTGDLVKDFDLQRGNRLSGEFRRPDGMPLGQDFWLVVDYLDGSTPGGEWLGDRSEGGRFDMMLPAGYVALKPPPAALRPYFLPRTRIDLHTGDVTNLVVLLVEKPDPYPTTPPCADRISVSEPDVDGYATITGHTGAVEPISAVIIINLSARVFTTTTADPGGAFSTRLYAPPGSSLLVKYDSIASAIDQVRREAETRMVDTSGMIYNLNPLPGTILHVGELPVGNGTSQFFHSVGSFGSVLADDSKAWAGWQLSGTLEVPTGGPGPGLRVQPGQQVRLTARLRVTSPALQCAGALSLTPRAHVRLRYLFAADGQAQPWGIWFNAHLFTPTGLPIEHEAGGEIRGVGSASFDSLTCVSARTFEGFLDTTFTIPGDLPEGMYLPEAFIESGDVPLAEDRPQIVIWYHVDPTATLPPLAVGTPAPPRIPWTLLGNYPINGHRGVQAREDEGRWVMPARVVYPPHEVVVPRLDARTGEPRAYRLEPGSHWLSATDRRQPNPPHIPLALPSGELFVEVHKPDGSTRLLGPAPIRQSSVRTPTLPSGDPLYAGTGQIDDLYHLTTLEEPFDYRFDQYGHHVIRVLGAVNDVYGNTYPIESTYDVHVARVLDLDPAQLPTTPYMQGDAFAPGLHIFPPVSAEVVVHLRHMPHSNPERAITHVIEGRANRFGYFQPPPGTEIRFEDPGEFRVDITAIYEDPDGTLWMGTMTWGNVVEGFNAQIEAHDRRGMDYKSDRIDDMPAWYEVANLPSNKVGIENYYPYFSGDIHWGSQNVDLGPGDSIHSIITVRDKTPLRRIYQTMRNNWPRARNGFRWPPTDTSLTGLNKRLAVGEAPLFMTTGSGIDPGVAPDQIDLWGYWYGSSERPDVHVRELISEDNMGTAYWRFDDTYGYQIGEGAMGDLPGDIKWEFGGAVFRVPGREINEYAIYSSLWVLLPDEDPVGARIAPPFQDATGAGINGGPILTLKGQDIDMLFLPKGVRPGDVLESGDTVSFSGHVGPPLDSRVGVVITSPGGRVQERTWHANKIGWIYDPSFDFIAEEPGRWTVDVFVEHDRPYAPNGVVPTRHKTGTVLGTSGRYEFYVVPPEFPRLEVISPPPGFLWWPNGHVEPVEIRGLAPAGTEAVHFTIHDKGVVIAQGSVRPDAEGEFIIIYDARALHAEFPFVSLTAHEGRWEGLADEVAINFLAVGVGISQANTVTLIGEEVFIGRN